MSSTQQGLTAITVIALASVLIYQNGFPVIPTLIVACAIIMIAGVLLLLASALIRFVISALKGEDVEKLFPVALFALLLFGSMLIVIFEPSFKIFVAYGVLAVAGMIIIVRRDMLSTFDDLREIASKLGLRANPGDLSVRGKINLVGVLLYMGAGRVPSWTIELNYEKPPNGELMKVKLHKIVSETELDFSCEGTFVSISLQIDIKQDKIVELIKLLTE